MIATDVAVVLRYVRRQYMDKPGPKKLRKGKHIKGTPCGNCESCC